MSPENFDQAIRSKLENWTAPVREDQWLQLVQDKYIQEKTVDLVAAVPAGLWERMAPQINPDADKILRDKLYHVQAPVREEVWENIQAEKEKRRRVIFWWNRSARVAAALLMFMSGALVAAYYYLDKPGHPMVVEQATGAGKQNNISKKPSPGNNATLAPLSEKLAEADGTKGVDLSPLPSSSSSPRAAGSNESFLAKKANPQQPSLWVGQDFSLPPYKNNTNANPNVAEDESVTAAAYVLSPKSGWAIWQPIVTKTLLTAPLSLTDLHHADKIKNVVICPTDRKNRNTDWDLEVFAGPGLGMKSVSSNGASNAFLQKKDSAESGRLGFSAGFRLVKPLNDHFSLKTGLNYTQHNEKFVYRTEDQIKTTTVVTVRTIIRAPGDTLRINDTSVVQQAGFLNNTVKNHFRSIDIPLLAAYRWGNEDFSIGIQGGVVMNLSSWYEGVIMDSSLAPVVVNKEGGMVYKNKLGLGLLAGIQVSKKIGYSTHLFAEPYFRYHFNNMTQAGAAYQQKINFGGLSVGLRFNLNNR